MPCLVSAVEQKARQRRRRSKQASKLRVLILFRFVSSFCSSLAPSGCILILIKCQSILSLSPHTLHVYYTYIRNMRFIRRHCLLSSSLVRLVTVYRLPHEHLQRQWQRQLKTPHDDHHDDGDDDDDGTMDEWRRWLAMEWGRSKNT